MNTGIRIFVFRDSAGNSQILPNIRNKQARHKWADADLTKSFSILFQVSKKRFMKIAEHLGMDACQAWAANGSSHRFDVHFVDGRPGICSCWLLMETM